MSIRLSTVLTAGLLSVLLAAGSIATVHAGGEGCDKDKRKGDSTSTLWCPGTTAQQPAAETGVRP